MKKFLLGIFALATILSCSKNGINENSDNTLNAGETVVKFTLAKGNYSKAITTADDYIKSATAYIFKDNVLTQMVTMTRNSMGVVESSDITVAAGASTVITIANLSDNWKTGLGDMYTAAVGQTTPQNLIDAYRSVMVNNKYLTTPVTNYLDFANITVFDDADAASNATGFVMHSNSAVTIPEGGTADAPASVTISLNREVSLLGVAFDTSVLGVVGTSARKMIPGLIKDVKFAASNTSKEIPLANSHLTATGGYNFDTPTKNYTATQLAAPASLITNSKYFGHLYGIVELQHATDKTTLGDNAFRHAPENSTDFDKPSAMDWFSDDLLYLIPSNIVSGLGYDAGTMAANNEVVRGEVTYAVLMCPYIPTPEEMAENHGGTLHSTPDIATVPFDFYAIRRVSDRSIIGKFSAIGGFFYTEAAAQAYIDSEYSSLDGTASSDFEVVRYVGGKMYYRIDLANNMYNSDEKKKYSVLPNSFYTMDVNKVNDYGYPSVEDLDDEPIGPVEESTVINATIMIEYYIDINMTPDLG